MATQQQRYQIIFLFSVGLVIAIFAVVFILIFDQPPESTDFRRTRAVELAIDSLSQQERTAEENIELKTVEDVTWPNNCLEAPAPNETCHIEQIEGYKIVLTIEDKQYVFHSDTVGSNLRLADKP